MKKVAMMVEVVGLGVVMAYSGWRAVVWLSGQGEAKWVGIAVVVWMLVNRVIRHEEKRVEEGKKLVQETEIRSMIVRMEMKMDKVEQLIRRGL